MSNYWDVYCTECCSRLGVDNANHAEEHMLKLISIAPKLTALGTIIEVLDGAAPGVVHIETKVNDFYRFDVRWFAKHGWHKLVPIDESGRISKQCATQVECECCGDRRWCGLESGHEGKHVPMRRR